MTKETLLKYEGFVDNEYLDEYLNFINSKQENNVYTVTQDNKHNVIPACWYGIYFCKTEKKALYFADADINQEFVILTPQEHLYVHELLTKCTSGKFAKKTLLAYHLMTHRKCYTEETPKDKKRRLRHLIVESSNNELSSHQTTVVRKQMKVAINELARVFKRLDESRTWEDCKSEAEIIIVAALKNNTHHFPL